MRRTMHGCGAACAELSHRSSVRQPCIASADDRQATIRRARRAHRRSVPQFTRRRPGEEPEGAAARLVRPLRPRRCARTSRCRRSYSSARRRSSPSSKRASASSRRGKSPERPGKPPRSPALLSPGGARDDRCHGCEPRARRYRRARGDRGSASRAGPAGVPHRRPAGCRGARGEGSRARRAQPCAVRVSGAAHHGQPRARRPAEGFQPLRSADRAGHPRRERAARARSARRARVRRRAFAYRASCARCAARSRWRYRRARAGRAFVLPEGNAPQAALAEGARILPARTLLEVVAHLTGEARLQRLFRGHLGSRAGLSGLQRRAAASRRRSARSRSRPPVPTAC